ncbi:hypothetical protein [Kaistella antarctica]|uniref:Lipoprotein n=1 Tax=Kaistella antarctica TaxID=266748 RepID=A0A448NQS0_9FLAO|nr:hypothetical protein [Kaistella antarctica]SEW12380.1 hypothetical protein SAMN05421765_2462 [Kaistella antarctica]VEH99021.1 Uncharacterised protein [Kaistella antarctica]
MKSRLSIALLLVGLVTLQSCKNEKVESTDVVSNAPKIDTAVIPDPEVEMSESPGTQIYSELRKQDIALQAEAVILNSVAEGSSEKAYLIFNEDESKVEVFLPENSKGFIYERKGTEGNYTWTDGLNELIQWKGYVLRTLKQAKPLFAGDLKYQ